MGASIVVCVWAVALAGCFNYNLPYPGDGTTDSTGDPDAVADADVDMTVDTEDDRPTDATADTATDPVPDLELDTDRDPVDDRVTDTSGDIPGDAPPIPTLVLISANTFSMGSPDTGTEPGRGTDENQHDVTLTVSFWMMETEVTQPQFFAVMGYDRSSHSSCSNCPATNMNWHEAADYANRLSLATGYTECYDCTGTYPSISCDLDSAHASPYDCPGYRLPTEAEWEFAARAGTSTATYNGTCDSGHLLCEQPNTVLDTIAWFCGNDSSNTNPVRTQNPNPWGLYDMLGNVWEWTYDWLTSSLPTTPVTDPSGPGSGTDRSMRGGSWGSGGWTAQHCRAAERHGEQPNDDRDNLGFRLVRNY
ncbi:MAG: SUMF1/EgtB/PvdO family nonheme iron enzyme [Deltaproteobacteria bacterium]|nr:SUMF1/EgtB/PvdO family nonheme iron enzyme [Deltaproteobacteria bacterium]